MEEQMRLLIVVVILLALAPFRVDAAAPGDTNGDGHVNHVDFSALALSYLTYPSWYFNNPGRNNYWNPACDFNHDNIVNVVDFSILAANYGK